MYDKLAGMTGTAKTEEDTQRIYNLDVVMAPTYKPIADDMPDMVYRTPEVSSRPSSRTSPLHQRGQPVLVGTVAIGRASW